jgi:hypothetical protein
MKRSRLPIVVVLLLMCSVATAQAAVEYKIADGHADLVLSIDPDETLVLMNTFPVDPAGQYIERIRIAYGRVGGPTALNGLPVKILLYEDTNGGSPQDATLLWSQDAVIANGNTDILNDYVVPGILVHDTLVAALYFKNIRAFPVYIGALDTTAPTLTARSYFGFLSGGGAVLDPANLGQIPASQFMAQEASGNPGNYRMQVRGRSTQNADVSLSASRIVASGSVRLGWSGSEPTYDVERASQRDFSNGVVIAPGVTGPTYDDPVLTDGATWFYRVP